jgi:hypothetical protein
VIPLKKIRGGSFMRDKVSTGLIAVTTAFWLMACTCVALLSATRLNAQTEAVLYSFKPDLSNPVFGVILGPEGVLYGTVSRKQADPSQFNGPRPCFRVSRVLVKDEGSEENYAN